jgi:antirestriction protein
MEGAQHEQQQGGHEDDPEKQTVESPMIYVASLSDYNAGRLHGRWIDAARGPEHVAEQTEQMLADSAEDGAEEVAIHDYIHFGAWSPGEYESIHVVCRVAEGSETHGPAFSAWVFSLDDPAGDGALDDERFEEAYRGHWGSMEAYAEELVEELGHPELTELSESWLGRYLRLDVAMLARDLALDLQVVEATDGGVYVFDVE